MKRMMRKQKIHTVLCAVLCLILLLVSGCAAPEKGDDGGEETDKNGEVYILYTSDVHCAIDQGFGYEGLWQVRDTLESQGYTVLLVDNGDSVQGETIGTITKGETMIRLMNEMGYDVAIPGNHEFDYGTQRFLELTEKAEFPYICCNFTYLDEPVFDPYIIKEAAGIRIAFVGVSTPSTVTTSTPTFFRDDDGNYVYGFMQDETGEKLYSAVQSAVDSARAEGADLVYVLGHLGMHSSAEPWTYADVIEHTGGIDVFLDGHSHDTEQVVMKDRDGKDVVRSACGTKLSCIGYSHISADGKVLKTGIWSWPNDGTPSDLFGYWNEMSKKVEDAKAELEEMTSTVIARSDADLTIYDPEEKDASGNPIRMIRRAETNMGDFCADVLLASTDADLALICGGAIRSDIHRGDVTYGDVMRLWPFQNSLCMIEVTGQQILDALEWGARSVPDENGGFLHPSGLKYEIHVSVPSGCEMDDNGMMTGITGERRVKNVMVGGLPIDPGKTYKVAGIDYTLIDSGDGHTAFAGAKVLIENGGLDSQVLIDCLTGKFGAVIGSDYADPYGQGRIVIIED